MGESGGICQTIGMVRYSGCKGSATLWNVASAYTGERRAASNQSARTPC